MVLDFELHIAMKLVFAKLGSSKYLVTIVTCIYPCFQVNKPTPLEMNDKIGKKNPYASGMLCTL